MKKIRSLSRKLRLIIAGGLTAILGGVLLLPHTQAALGQFAVIPTSSSVQNGNNISFNLRIHPLTEAYGIEVTLKYDQSKLQYISTNASGSVFGSDLPTAASGNGTVYIARGTAPGQFGATGDSYIAQVTFKALAGSGNTSLTLGGDVAGPSGAIPTTNGVGAVNLTSPASPSPNPASPSPSPSAPRPSTPSPSPTPGTPSPSPSPTPTPSPSPSSGGSGNNNSNKKISVEVKKRRIEFNRVTLEAIAKEKVRVYIKYGLDKEQLTLSTPLTDFKDDHQVELPSASLVAGTTYYYKVVIEDQAGNTTESDIADFRTKGYKLTLFVGGKNERRFAHKKVTLKSEPQTAKTDANGFVTFEDVAPGNHHLEFEQDGQTHSQLVNVDDPVIQNDADGNQNASAVQATVIFNDVTATDGTTIPVLPASIAAALTVAAIGAFVIMKRRKQGLAWQGIQTSNPFGPNPTQPPATSTPQADPKHPEDLIHRVAGLKKPDPGSIVAPDQDKDKDQR